ncbi:MAG: SDR family oxidoreductase [Rhodobacter sp.]|nr:SDR family oxidoreductase [Rhodobacter sp.]
MTCRTKRRSSRWAQIDRHTDRIDVLVNNAAIGPTMAPTVDTDIAHFRLTLRTNVDGLCRGSRGPRRGAAGRGHRDDGVAGRGARQSPAQCLCCVQGGADFADPVARL